MLLGLLSHTMWMPVPSDVWTCYVEYQYYVWTYQVEYKYYVIVLKDSYWLGWGGEHALKELAQDITTHATVCNHKITHATVQHDYLSPLFTPVEGTDRI